MKVGTVVTMCWHKNNNTCSKQHVSTTAKLVVECSQGPLTNFTNNLSEEQSNIFI